MKLIGICDKDTAVGLRLAGVKDLYIPNGNLINIWNEISDRNDIG
ncbi:MAG: V-type ATP synthase subunit F, partial [Asgard group archaeon]|nr:V-type ATP synthase subunit F [Asgard group archaeon]